MKKMRGGWRWKTKKWEGKEMDDQKKGERVEMRGRLPHEPSPPSQDVFDTFPKLQFLQF